MHWFLNELIKIVARNWVETGNFPKGKGKAYQLLSCRGGSQKRHLKQGMKFVRRTQIIWSALLQLHMYTDRHIHRHRFHAQIDYLVPNKCHVMCTPSHHASEISILSSFLVGWYFHYDARSSASQLGMENMYCTQKTSMCIYIILLATDV